MFLWWMLFISDTHFRNLFMLLLFLISYRTCPRKDYYLSYSPAAYLSPYTTWQFSPHSSGLYAYLHFIIPFLMFFFFAWILRSWALSSQEMSSFPISFARILHIRIRIICVSIWGISPSLFLAVYIYSLPNMRRDIIKDVSFIHAISVICRFGSIESIPDIEYGITRWWREKGVE